MLDGLVDWLKELTVFIVICETILSFSPSGAYKKYIKPFVGLILLLRITSFLFGAVQVDWNQRIESVFEDYEQSVSRYLENIPVVQEEDELMEKIAEYENGSISDDEIKLNEELIKVDDVIISPIHIGEVQ